MKERKICCVCVTLRKKKDFIKLSKGVLMLWITMMNMCRKVKA